MSESPSNQAVLVGIESGGTKLQVAVSHVDDPNTIISELRGPIDRANGAAGILAQIESCLASVGREFEVRAIGYGFGGPVDAGTGRVLTSHQVAGWDDFDLASWLLERCPVPVRIGNDCNVAGLAEARLGAGQGVSRMLYVTVGTGIGGGMIIDGNIDGAAAPAVAEVGHLRPGIAACSEQQTVESIASGLGIETTCRAAIENPASWNASDSDARALVEFEQATDSRLSAKLVSEAAREGNELARAVMRQATQTLGWALAQATTLLAPQRVVVGGGVTLGGPEFLTAVRSAWETYSFPPLRDYCEIVPAQLGERVVLHGALLLAADANNASSEPNPGSD